MSVLDYNFTLLTYCGVWRPQEWPPGWKTQLYNSYTGLAICIVLAMTVTEIIDILLSFGDLEDFVTGMYMMLTMTSVCGKILTMLIYRERMIRWLEILESPVCQSNNSAEVAVREPYHQTTRIRTKSYSVLLGAIIVAMTISNSLMNIPKRTLPVKTWLPFNVGTGTVYWLVFFEEFLSLFIAAIIDIAYDTLVPGFMSLICEQFGLLKVRMEMFLASNDYDSDHFINNQTKIEHKLFTDFVRHNNLIFQLADEANSIFGPGILLQYIVSSLVICMCIYELGQIESFGIQMFSVIIYTSGMFLQIFLLCLAGTELADESQEFNSIFCNSDWYKLSISSRKNVIVMMIRNSKPIIFTSANVIQISLDSYLKIIESSYSAYNFLQQSST